MLALALALALASVLTLPLTDINEQQTSRNKKQSGTGAISSLVR